MPAAGNRANYSPGAGPQQPAADCSLGRVVGVRKGGSRQQQASRDYPGMVARFLICSSAHLHLVRGPDTRFRAISPKSSAI
jgi:hypothetical protein